MQVVGGQDGACVEGEGEGGWVGERKGSREGAHTASNSDVKLAGMGATA